MEAVLNNVLFGILLTIGAFEIGIYINKKTKSALLNPILIAIAIIIAILLFFNIDYEVYNNGGKFINMFLGPATVALAIPLYKQLSLLKKHFIPILVGITLGSALGIASIIFMGRIFSLEENLLISLLPKSVTTPIGIELSNNLGGIVSVTIMSIIITGLLGAILGPYIVKFAKIKDPIAIGVSFGTSAHAIGTTKALEIGEIEGSMSSLSIGIAGLLTVFLAPIIYNISLLFI